MVLKYYFDLLSQPSRALYIFLKMNKIPYESCQVALRKGEQLTDDYEKINRFKKVPAIIHNDFKLAESVAIFRYLSREYPDKIQPNWYPTDSKTAARIDEFMEWQHHNIRIHGSMYFLKTFMFPTMFGKPKPSADEVDELINFLEKSLNDMEHIFLKDNKYLCGNEITVADLLGSTEVEQPRSIGYEVYKDRPILKAWMNRVREATMPFYDEAHEYNYKLAKRMAKL